MTDDSLAPDEAFAVLGDETRIAILRALFDRPHEPLSFSELREAVGMRDSGRFNYHLGKLTGRFVRKVEGGYELRLAGWQVLGAILAGTFTESGNVDPVAYDDPCPHCGGTVVATYADERLRVACEDCEEQFTSAGLPPGALEGFDHDELPERYDRVMRSLIDRSRQGICVSCMGRMEPELVTEPNPQLGIDEDDLPGVVYRCRRCPEVVAASVGSAVLDHPAVVGFHWDHGVDVRSVPTWTLTWLDEATVASEDPLQVRVTVELDGETLELVLDERLDTVRTERIATP